MANYSPCRCYAALEGGGRIVPHTISRRPCGTNDVVVAIKFCGVCHTDIHMKNEDWGKGIFPMVPGHEIVGVAIEVGSAVTKFRKDDFVAVGTIVDSCRTCEGCLAGTENLCSKGCVLTYGSKYKFPHSAEYNEEGGAPTYGGYSQTIVIDSAFVLKIPSGLDLAGAAPLLCAGITTYSPLRRFNLQSSHKFAVCGLGGLGHMGVKFGKAFGAHTTVISRGSKKRVSALDELGADDFLDSTDAEAMAAARGRFDLILDTVSAPHNIDQLIALLKPLGTLTIVGAPKEPLQFRVGSILMGSKSIVGSGVGGLPETQEMLNFCGEHNITADIELISAEQINDAYPRTESGDVKYRFVIDASTI